jgi:SAM-dependent methyltransferase
MSADKILSCPLCGGPSSEIGTKQGQWRKKDYTYRRCGDCSLVFVENPDRDFSEIYDDDYYAGKGADPVVDYCLEAKDPRRSIREYEWRGIVEIICALTDLNPKTRWLDFGCGNGDLVRHVREKVGCEIVGFEQGAIARSAVKKGIPVLRREELARLGWQFDVVTALDVLEHVPHPVETLGEVFRLLKNPGVFFYTTGNAQPFRKKILKWSYARPEIHISLYEPETMRRGLVQAGFDVSWPGYLRGYSSVYRHKILKNLSFRRRCMFSGLLPWRLVGRLVDWKWGLSRFPVGLKRHD